MGRCDVSEEGQRLIARGRLRLAATNGRSADAEPASTPDASPTSAFPDLIPDLDSGELRSQADLDLDREIKAMPLEQAYLRWIDKGAPKMTGRADGNMVRCPRSDHTDSVPSAWINTTLNVGTCSVCRGRDGRQWGFDHYDLFAIHTGMNVDSYKLDGSFPELRRRLAEELGHRVYRSAAGKELVEPATEEPEEAPEDREAPAPPSLAVVTPFELPEEELETLGEFSGGTIDWRSLLTDESTFLRNMMEVCCEDDLPEEYYLWLGLTAIGMVCGNEYLLNDRQPVRGNLMVCLVGRPGIGKSRSIYALRRLLHLAQPFHPGSGVRLIPDPGSGESLIDAFVILDEDKKPLPTRGLLVIDELATMAAKASRTGSTLKGKIQEFYDTPDEVSITSRANKDVAASGHFCSIVATTQPDLMNKLLTSDDLNSGFVSRWVFVTGTPKPLHPLGGAELDVESLKKPLADLRSFTAKGRKLSFNADAVALWTEFFRKELEPVKLSTNVMARADLLMKKLVLLLAADRHRLSVDDKTVNQAITLWPYLKRVYGLVEGRTSTSTKAWDTRQVEEKVKFVIAAMNKDHRLATTGAVWKVLPSRFRQITPRESVTLAIKQLELIGEIEAYLPEKKKGRPPVGPVYRIVT